jgi:hypothetical protein
MVTSISSGIQKGVSRAELQPLIGGRGRVSEVLNRKRALSVGMIRALSDRLGIPAEVLLAPYDLRTDPPGHRHGAAVTARRNTAA